MIIRPTTLDDAPGVLALYRRVAEIPGGIARLACEVSESYVVGFLSKAIADGIALVVAEETSNVIAEIHACRPGPYCFSHVLTDLTVVVANEAQGNGVGRRLFDTFLDSVANVHTNVTRVELIARQSNEKALMFYESLGFRKEGELVGRIKNVDGSIESDIPMAWTRPD